MLHFKTIHESRMQAPQPQIGAQLTGGRVPPVWIPPVSPDLLVAFVLVVIGSNIELVPNEYRPYVANPLVIFVGMFITAGLAGMGMIPTAFAVAFCLVNLVRVMPQKKKVSPGAKEGFVPSGTLDWVTTNKKWFVEKVLMERPVAIQEKEISTYPVQS